MGFEQLKKIPFRSVKLHGVTKFVCDLGNFRLITEDLGLLDGGPTTTVDPYSGYKVEHEYSVNLPAKVKVVKDAVNSVITLSPRDELIHEVLMVGRQKVWSGGVYGEIITTEKSPKVLTHSTWVYDFIEKVDNAWNQLQGIIIYDQLSEDYPMYYKNMVHAKTKDRYGLESYRSFKMLFGEIPEVTPHDSFIADSEVEMLALTIKKADRCYRTDLEISFINVTGGNGSITDWKSLAAEDTLRDEFDSKLKAQETKLIGIAAALS